MVIFRQEYNSVVLFTWGSPCTLRVSNAFGLRPRLPTPHYWTNATKITVYLLRDLQKKHSPTVNG